MRRTANEFEQIQISVEESPPNMTALLKQHVRVPEAGGLNPRPSIQNHVRAQMQTQRNAFQKLRDLFQLRVPMYQAAFGMVMATFVIFASTQVLTSHNSTRPQPAVSGLDSTAVQNTIGPVTLQATPSDSAGTYQFGMPDTFSTTKVDTL